MQNLERTTYHIQTVRTLTEKCTEYNVPLPLAFVDYKKAFDSIEPRDVMDAIGRARIDLRYTKIERNIYLATEKISIEKGNPHGDAISPKLFTLALRVFSKPWKG